MSKWTFKDIPKINEGLVEWWRKRHPEPLPAAKGIPNLDEQEDYRNYYGLESYSMADSNGVPRAGTMWARRNPHSLDREWEREIYEADRHN